MTPEERAREEELLDRLLQMTSGIFGEGFGDGAGQVAQEYDFYGHVEEAADKLKPAIAARRKILQASVDRYRGRIEAKTQELIDQGLPANVIRNEIFSYARNLADERAEVIAQTEFATGRLAGAQAVVDQAGLEYEWRFPHFDLNPDEKEECDICEEIRQGSPYTTAEAEELGFPEFPHEHCDHGWVIVPLGEQTQTEQFNP